MNCYKKHSMKTNEQLSQCCYQSHKYCMELNKGPLNSLLLKTKLLHIIILRLTSTASRMSNFGTSFESDRSSSSIILSAYSCNTIITSSITLILLEPKVISLCHQYIARPACKCVQSDQALY